MKKSFHHKFFSKVKDVGTSVESKTKSGYAVKAIESIQGIDEDKAGVTWAIKTLISTRFCSPEPRGDFRSLVKYLDKKHQDIQSGQQSAFDIMTYCKKCKDIVSIKVEPPRSPMVCKNCNTNQIEHQ